MRIRKDGINRDVTKDQYDAFYSDWEVVGEKSEPKPEKPVKETNGKKAESMVEGL